MTRLSLGLFSVGLLLGAARAEAEPSFCQEEPSAAASSASLGKPSHGRLEGARAIVSNDSVRVLPLRHAQRCLNYGTARLVDALVRAGESVRRKLPDSPPLGVGDLSKARGGAIHPYSHSHQSGRDADLAFYVKDDHGAPVAAEDLMTFNAAGRAPGHRFDAERTWLLVRALLEDPAIKVQWLFISRPLKAALLAQAELDGEARPELRRRAAEVLHQPSDAPPHADHLHLRIDCSREERQLGCRS